MEGYEQWQRFVEKHGDTVGVLLLALIGVLRQFIQQYVWPDPQAIFFMFICYLVNYCADLYLLHQVRELTWKRAVTKMLNVVKNVAGALVLLYIATGAGKYSLVFFWLPQVMFGILLTLLITLILKHASRLGIITPEFARYLDARVTSTIIKPDDATAQPLDRSLDRPVEQPEREIPQ